MYLCDSAQWKKTGNQILRKSYSTRLKSGVWPSILDPVVGLISLRILLTIVSAQIFELHKRGAETTTLNMPHWKKSFEQNKRSKGLKASQIALEQQVFARGKVQDEYRSKTWSLAVHLRARVRLLEIGCTEIWRHQNLTPSNPPNLNHKVCMWLIVVHRIDQQWRTNNGDRKYQQWAQALWNVSSLLFA